MPYLVVEYTFDSPLSDESRGAAFEALKPCLEVRGIRRLRSYLSQDRKRGLCEFEAQDAQSLREAYREAQVSFERVWSGELVEFGAPTP
jgi:hypothetical protein